MIISITEKCNMGCSHCLGDYSPDGNDMTENTLQEVISFIRRIGNQVLLISGGEPTEHPRMISFIKKIQDELPDVNLIITSNGIFLESEEYTRQVLELGVPVQVTNDTRYYPRRIPMPALENVVYTSELICLFPQGRAKNNKPINISAPKCFNIRSIGCNQICKTFAQAVVMLEGYNKYCQPFIGVDGSVFLGESRLCTSIGMVTDTDNDLFYNLRHLRCDQCVLGRGLPTDMRSHIEI